MNPALSVIFFTTATGAGYGLLAIVGMMVFSNMPIDRHSGMIALGIGFVLVSFGLVSSTYHLGHPFRAWRAFSQWRSSWLSREGVVSMVCFIPMLWLLWMFYDSSMIMGMPEYAGVVAATLTFTAWLTVYCTAMIYRSLPTIAEWYTPLTMPCYILFSLMSGAVFLNAILMVLEDANVTITGLASLLAIWGWLMKRRYWFHIDNVEPSTTMESATGLGHLGKVRSFETPHSSDNYLLKEMGFVVARKHSARLRKLAIILSFGLPSILCALSIFFFNQILGSLLSGLAVIAVSLGLVIERWLFFAEARHVVNLYYGRDI